MRFLPQELIIITSHRVGDTLGGVEKFVSLFASWCTDIGLDVKVVSRALSLLPIRVTDGLNFKKEPAEIEFVRKIQLPFLLYYIGLAAFSVVAFVTLMKLIKSCRLNGNSVVALHSQDVNFAASATVLACKLLKLPSVLHQHGPYNELISPKHMQIIEKSLNILVCKLADAIIVTDRHARHYLENIVSNGSNISVIPAAVDLQSFLNVNSSKKIKFHDLFEIGYVGRLSQEKNLETLLSAFKEFQSIANSCGRLVIVGDGSAKKSLQNMTSSLEIDKYVEFTGFQTNVLPFLSDFDVFVLPSKVEGTPISLLEAMAAGKAVICSNIESLREIVEDGKAGLLFDVHNSKQLAKAMLTLYGSPELRKKLGINAKLRAHQYDVNVIFPRIIGSYPKKIA